MSENSKYRELFVQEALEHVDNLSLYLVKLEEEPSVKEHVDVLFRSAHTLKGMAATMQYGQITEICKAIEGIFEKLRQGETSISAGLGNVLLLGVDHLRELVSDETKRIDLEGFLEQVRNPGSIKPEAVGGQDSPHKPAQTPTVRVKMQDLDSLVNLVGQIMISKMQLDMVLQSHKMGEGRDVLMTLGRLVADLQYHTMQIRLVPIEQIFNRFSRMVRDLSTSLGKKVRMETEDSGIELDRTVLDAIMEPVLHMLRNSVDHGLEKAEEREALGKPAVGTIHLRARRVGQKVEIEVGDDGRGFDLEAIKSKAVERKVKTREEVETMSDEDIIGLVGTPGLSTAKEITDISGRGVGMDVVITQVKNVGGQVKIRTEKGKGTRIVLTIPTSLAVIGGLLVNVSNQKFIMPMSSISSTVTVDSREIQRVHGREMINLRGRIMPVVRASEVLGLTNDSCRKDGQVNIIVVNKEGAPYGLVVDSLEKEQEIVIKRLEGSSGLFADFANATILPDGKVALILEPTLLLVH
ncbi:MAG: chemotaxis protein CheA [Thaumarchaeota archaeon]|nr:chemotaxis protein CheA [Nitrososphaerota archaeon]